MTRALSILLLSLLLGGCETLSKKECLTADWSELGYRDGASGFPRSRAEDHDKACREVGVSVDRPTYFAARERGLGEYCQAENAYRIGVQGGGYARVCPPELAPMFERQYAAGRSVYDARQRLYSLEGESRRLEGLLQKAQTDEERRRLREDLRRLDRELSYARDDLRWREGQAARPWP